MLFPYFSDAADRMPWATLGVIAVNVAVLALLGTPLALALEFGTIEPLTWVTSTFVHVGWGHLVANMIVLWAAGLIVEGLAGCWRFLLLYLALGASVSAVVQLLMLGGEGYAAGASGAVFGLLAVTAVWAPRNHYRTAFWLFRWVYYFDMEVLRFVALVVGIELFLALLGGLTMSSALIHLLGAGAGVAVGIWMLESKWVDAGGWDWFSLRETRRPSLPDDLASPRPADPRAAALVDVRDALKAGRAAQADDRYASARRDDPGFRLPVDDLRALVEALRAAGLREPALARLEELVAHDPWGADAARLALVEELLAAGRPRRAGEELAHVDVEALTPSQREAHERLAAQAAASGRSDGLELE